MMLSIFGYEKKYGSDLTDAEWQVIKNVPPAKIVERKRRHELQRILDGILYVMKNGCIWCDLPRCFPPPPLAQLFITILSNLKNLILWVEFHDALREMARRTAKRNPAASLLAMDSQSVKTDAVSSARDAGIDAGKLVKGRKRHILVDTMGLLVGLKVHSAGIRERDGA